MANVHEGHRQRLRDRFLKEGLDGFAPHNVLELLLFYAAVSYTHLDEKGVT